MGTTRVVDPLTIPDVGTVDVWEWRTESSLRVGRNELSEVEWQDAARLESSSDMRRFVAGRAFVRRVLGTYVGVPPGSIELDGWRKPRLDASHQLEFSVGRSGDLALLAVTTGRAVGVHVAELGPQFSPLDGVRGFLCPAELDDLLDVWDKEELALSLLTRKEAYRKAKGVALTVPLNHVDARGDVIYDDEDAWRVHQVRRGREAATVVARGSERLSVRLRKWEGPTAANSASVAVPARPLA